MNLKKAAFPFLSTPLALLCVLFVPWTTARDSLPEITMPKGATLVFSEDWSTGSIDPDKWYALHKRWGKGNNGVVRQNVFVAQDTVGGETKNVVVCRGHGDQYKGPVLDGVAMRRESVGFLYQSRSLLPEGMRSL